MDICSRENHKPKENPDPEMLQSSTSLLFPTLSFPPSISRPSSKEMITLVIVAVQVIGLLCRTPLKDSRQELIRRVAAGGGVFQGKNDVKVHVPAANLNDIANQADDLPEVNFLTKLVALKPGKTVEEMIRNVMEGKDEGAEDTSSEEEDAASKKGRS